MLSDCNTSIPTVDGKPKGCFLFKKYVLTVYYVPSIVPATIFFSICCREKCLFKNFKILCIPALTKSIFKLYWHVPEPLRIHLFPHYIYIFSFNILLTLLLSLSTPHPRRGGRYLTGEVARSWACLPETGVLIHYLPSTGAPVSQPGPGPRKSVSFREKIFPATILSIRDTAVNKTDKNPWLWGAYILIGDWGRGTDNKINMKCVCTWCDDNY